MKNELFAKLCNGNSKTGKQSATWSKLATDRTFSAIVNGKTVTIKGSCGSYCDGCKYSCYCNNAYKRYKTVINRHTENTLCMREDIEKAFEQIEIQLSSKRIPFEIVRIHAAGELETKQELEKWIETARNHSESDFYIYSKAEDIYSPIMEDYYKHGLLPENFVLLVSIWHEYGIETFKKLAYIPNVKAFVYIDGFDYAEHGIIADAFCPAYTVKHYTTKKGIEKEKVVMNHELTCDKCKLCTCCKGKFGKFKIIACLAH